MRICKTTYLLAVLAALLITGCMKPKDNFLLGAWSSYTPRGIHSPAMNVHTFMEDGTYTKITLFSPPSEAMTANAHLSLTAYQIEGNYLLQEKDLQLSLEEETTRWHCEVDGDQLYFIDVASEGTNVVLLTRVGKKKGSAENGTSLSRFSVSNPL